MEEDTRQHGVQTVMTEVEIGLTWGKAQAAIYRKQRSGDSHVVTAYKYPFWGERGQISKYGQTLSSLQNQQITLRFCVTGFALLPKLRLKHVFKNGPR